VRWTVTGRTKTAVKTKLRQLCQELDNGVRSSATYTVGNTLDDWLAGGLSGRGVTGAPAHVRISAQLRRQTLEDIADLVGHKSTVTVTTEKVYWKVIVPELRRGAEVMDRLFS
jgi:hypothetical protein